MNEDLILKMVGKRLLDSTCEISNEEIRKAMEQLNFEIQILAHRMDVVRSREQILNRIIQNESLLGIIPLDYTIGGKL